MCHHEFSANLQQSSRGKWLFGVDCVCVCVCVCVYAIMTSQPVYSSPPEVSVFLVCGFFLWVCPTSLQQPIGVKWLLVVFFVVVVCVCV